MAKKIYIGSAQVAGLEGKSAYRSWLDQGNIGTEQDFLDSLKAATIITNDGSDGDSVAIKLTDNGSYQRTFRIDMTAEYTGGANEQRIGSLIIECWDEGDDIAHGYYYGDDMSDILTEVAVYQDDIDPDIFYLMLTHESSLDSVTFAITPTDGDDVDAIITNAADDHTKVDDANISPVGGGSSDVFVAEYGVTTYQQVIDAHNAGKIVIVFVGGQYVESLARIQANLLTFSTQIGTYLYRATLSSSNVWSNNNYENELAQNKVSTLSGNETDTTKYPNTKAVADALGVWGVESQTITFNADGTRTITNVVWGIIPQGEHNIYLACRGVEFNDTGSAISKTAPWGETVQHLPGYYYLNGLGDISREEMAIIYAESNALTYDITRARFQSCHFRTIIPASVTAYNWASGKSAAALFQHCSNLEVIQYVEITPTSANENIPDLTSMQGFATYAYNLYYAGVWKCGSSSNVTYVAYARTKYLWLKGLKNNLDIRLASNLDLGCLAYIITNAGTATITITVHANVYTAAQSDAGVQAALAAKTNVTLASA